MKMCETGLNASLWKAAYKAGLASGNLAGPTFKRQKWLTVP